MVVGLMDPLFGISFNGWSSLESINVDYIYRLDEKLRDNTFI